MKSILFEEHTLWLSWTLNRVFWVANTTPMGIRPKLPRLCQEYTLWRAYFLVELDCKHSYTTVCEASIFLSSHILFAMSLSSYKPTLTFRFWIKSSDILDCIFLTELYTKKTKCWANSNTNGNSLSTRLVLHLPLDLFCFFTGDYVTIRISIIWTPDLDIFSTSYCRALSIKPIALF